MSILVRLDPDPDNCPWNGETLSPDGHYKTEAPCLNCRHAEPQANGQVIRYARGAARVRCAYVPAEAVIEPTAEAVAETAVDPAKPAFEVMDTVGSFIQVMASRGETWIRCPVCGLRRADTCPRGDDPLAPCRNPA